MISKQALAQRLSEGSLGFASGLVEQAMLNDRLRNVVMNELEKYLMAEIQKIADPHLPSQVIQDKVDMGRALLKSANRALERRQISRKVLHRLLMTLLTNVILGQDEASKAAFQRFKESHPGQAPPTTMVISPTKACNLRCVGCYASAGTGAEQLEWDVFDRIITEAKTLWGLRFITISGGEPLAYRSRGQDLVDMVMRHNDCLFQMYTNSTLIDERMAERMAEAGNLIPAISVEGFEARTDGRRGQGVFQRILTAMANLRQVGVPFGISLTGTRHNAEEILSDEFIDFFFNEQQAVFGWLFQYMPIGRSYTLDLLVTPEQRLWMWERTWQVVRERHIMLADFWNCGTTSDGCIAAARDSGYMYIDWNGKVMPCVFVPYSPANILDIYRKGGTLDDIYDLPYFQAIRHWQSDYGLGKKRPEEHGNWLVPCSLRDHYGVGRELIDKYQPEPEDEAAADALIDGGYYEGMMAYDEELYKVFDPIWQQKYLNTPVS
jgi:MoaA/NifB/PqqE/SkfB family radical SAM enzyme